MNGKDEARATSAGRGLIPKEAGSPMFPIIPLLPIPVRETSPGHPFAEAALFEEIPFQTA